MSDVSVGDRVRPAPEWSPGHSIRPSAGSANRPGPASRERWWKPSGLAEWFVIGQTVLPALLYLPGSQPYRLPLREGAYAISLFVLVVWWFDRGGRRVSRHPAERWLWAVFVCLSLMIAHPYTPDLYAGVAQIALYVSIFCPLFWAPEYVRTPHQLIRLLVLLLICNGANAMVGVLQVYDPARWMPAELSATVRNTPGMLAAATYVGPNGALIIRPPGLFDTPGSVCGPGATAAFLGLLLALEPVAWWKRVGSLALAFAGISVIYLTHVRASLVAVLCMMAAYAGLLAVTNQKARSTLFAGLGAGLIVVGLFAATFLGGEAVEERFSTLLQGDPRNIYAESRGAALRYAFDDLIVEYPLGAGLGRWGMMSSYFGAPQSSDTQGVFAEIQPSAWILDGGVFLLVFYGLALGATVVHELRLASAVRDAGNRTLICVVAAVNIGTIALAFSFVPFGTAMGTQYWFLEGALNGVIIRALKKS
jgi:hypothetical protein